MNQSRELSELLGIEYKIRCFSCGEEAKHLVTLHSCKWCGNTEYNTVVCVDFYNPENLIKFGLMNINTTNDSTFFSYRGNELKGELAISSFIQSCIEYLKSCSDRNINFIRQQANQINFVY